MFYVLDEQTRDFKTDKNVTITRGVNTGRIFALNVPLPKPTYHDFLNRLDDVRKALGREMVTAETDVKQKNYELILSLVNKTLNIATAQREQIESVFKSSEAA